MFIDCGAYRGETVNQFVNWIGGSYKKIYALEPDIENFKILNEFIKVQNYKNVETFNLGAWNRQDNLYFEADGTRGAHLIDSGISKNETANQTVNQTANSVLKMSVDALDNLIDDKKADLLKMDVEGSELKALQGAVGIIQTSKPILAICLYHKSEDMFTIPQYIKQLDPSYKIYFRKHSLVSSFELVLYAV